jgi:hypothetical protein
LRPLLFRALNINSSSLELSSISHPLPHPLASKPREYTFAAFVFRSQQEKGIGSREESRLKKKLRITLDKQFPEE